MKNFILLATFFIFSANCFSQQIVDLEENSPYSYNRLEYGFYVANERSKKVNGDDYERCEVNLYVTKKSGCIKFIPFKTTPAGKTAEEEMPVAEFMER